MMSRVFLCAALALVSGCEDGATAVDGAVAGDGTAAADASAIDPSATGPCQRETKRLQIPRDGRNLFLALQLPVPDAFGPLVCRGKRSPIVLLVPTSQQASEQYTSYAEHLASHGFAAIIVDYPDDPFQADHRASALDLRAVLDWASAENNKIGGPYRERFDATQAAVVGHGTGAAVALLAALGDPRIVAAVGLDPVDGNPFAAQSDPRYPSVTPEQLGRYTRPLLLLGETTNGSCLEQGCRACAPLAENYQRFFAGAGGLAIEVTFPGADHNDWLDDPDCGFICDACARGVADAAAVRRLSRKYLAAFLLWAVRADAGALGFLCTGSQPETTPGAAQVECRDNGKLPTPSDGGVLDAPSGDGQPADAGPADLLSLDQPA